MTQHLHRLGGAGFGGGQELSLSACPADVRGEPLQKVFSSASGNLTLGFLGSTMELAHCRAMPNLLARRSDVSVVELHERAVARPDCPTTMVLAGADLGGGVKGGGFFLRQHG
jgi:hypothetical protein